MSGKNDAYAFISYSSNDRKEAQHLYEILTNRFYKITCWMDVLDINTPNDAFQEQIIRGIRNASCLVLVETEDAKKSSYVDLEVKTAIDQNIPTFRYKVQKNQSKFVETLRMFFLAQGIKFRLTQPYWVSLIILASMLGVMAVTLFLFGKVITPTVVNAVNRILPEAIPMTIEIKSIEEIISPDVAAPFHYIPDNALLLEDFNSVGVFDSGHLFYDIIPPDQEVKVAENNGSLSFSIPATCQQQEDQYSCEIEIHSQQFELTNLQYFGFRARINSITEGQNLSLSISVPSWTRRRTGFGWNISEHVTPFFRSSPSNPETDFYAHVSIDDSWHAYEILLDPDTSKLFYYIDGQIIDTHQMMFYDDWKSAPLCLIIYALGNGETSGDIAALIDTNIEIDQIIVGGIN